MARSLLLLCPFFYPEPISTGRYNTYLVKALLKNRIDVEVICFHPLYPEWHPQTSNEGISGVTIYRGGEWLRYPKNSLMRRAILEGAFLFNLLRHIGQLKNYSRIVAVLPPMLFMPILWIMAGRYTKIIAIVHDLQGIMAEASLKKGRYAVIKIIRFFEETALKCCHRIIVLSNGMAAFLLKAYKLPRSKVSVRWPFVTVKNNYLSFRLGHLFAEGKKHIVYSGGLGYKQCPEKLVSFFLNLVKKRGDVVCHIFSGGPIFDALRRDGRLENDRFIFHDLVSEYDLNELYMRSHIHIIPEKKGVSKGALPSKLPNLLAIGVPVLYVGEKNSDVWRLIKDCDAGFCTDSWDFEQLNSLVDQLLIEGEQRSHSDRRYSFQKKYAGFFSVEALVEKLLE